MENTLLAVSAPPFWHCGRTIDKAMRWMLAALMPAAIMAVVNWGIPALRVMALSTATAVAAEALACRLIHRPVRVDNLHGAIIGLLFAFLLPASAPWWLVMFGSAVSVLIGKMAFGGLGASPLCAPLVGWAALFISWPLLMDPNTSELTTSFIDPLVRLRYFGAASAEALPWADLLLGRQIGALGASQVGALILGETAVSAGILSVPILTTAAAATVATLAVPSLYEQTILFRFAVILLAGCFGVPGLAAAALTVLAMACGSEPFGYDYLYPLMPPGPAAWRDGFVRSIWSSLAKAGEVLGRDET